MSDQPVVPEVPSTNVSAVTTTKTSYVLPLSIFAAGCMIAAAIALVYRPVSAPIALPVPNDMQNVEEFDIWQTPQKGMTGNEEIDKIPLVAEDYTDYSSYYKNIQKQVGVEWYQHPIHKDNLGLIIFVPPKNTGGYETSIPPPPEYFQIGLINGKPIMYADIPCDGMCFGNDYAIFVGDTITDAQLLTKHTTQDFSSEYSLYAPAPGVVENNTLAFAALKFNTIMYQEATLTGGANNFFTARTLSGFFANSRFNPTILDRGEPFQNLEFLVDTEYGPLFRAYNINEEGTADFMYAVRTVGGLIAYYDLSPKFFSDDRVPAITWSDGTKNQTMYRMDGLGSCGGGGPEIAVTRVNDSDLTVAGIASTGEIIYTITNQKHPLVTRVFAATNGTVYDYNEITGESQTYTITPAEFITKRGVIVSVDELGYQNIFTNGDFGPQAECAKPVIYLYPTATTTISVDVDALITKSDPLYQNGWTVEAAPTGALVHNGSTYTSLFWDGYGNGSYPELTEGFVTETDNALSLMEFHLSYMGFNETEIREFSEFWKPHLPTEPYTKFSWIQTVEMQQLAALKITPPPRTLIRAFVDFSGVESREVIAPQTLKSQERIGYTATEWGGILRK